ncbi:MAG TPA: ATP-binding cassette domain-containing protein [Mollicutes bacterium]|nr:ATP-binding cassette domain-containing protein [Mollicutes bacterium]
MAIEIKEVSYVYNENTPSSHTALKNINVTIEEEKVTGIIGKIGSGKTTLVELLNALLIPTKGEVKVAGFDIEKKMKPEDLKALRRKVGLVFQFPEDQFFNITVKEEVAFALKHFRYKSDRVHKQVLEALSMVGLDESYLNQNVFNLSTGEKRKVAIASILVFNPKIIILDEPTVGLDYNNKKKLLMLIKKLKNKYNKTIIIVSHDIDMLNIVADNIIVMDKGEVVISAPKNEVLKEDSLKNHGLSLPKITEFIEIVATKKGIKLKNTTDIKDLIKDVYRHV